MTELHALYQKNYTELAKQSAELLKAGRFSELDIEHLLEELESMGASERNELENRLVILMAHLLKWQFQYQQLSERWQGLKEDSWRSSIVEQRARLAKRLRKSPGLKSDLDEVIAEVYEDAVEIAVKETQLPESTFPIQCPYTIKQLFDDNFYPEHI
ncbi:DUF29 domain-containing protein [Candidatus Albibeggiatoa sp. nov. BB20]|uniref:DUF29 domain-containing protein n=1 Tax=Candidatus Albibeggiatoa sp. nov. BB20 TaxID=3162723 RepID=UPI0033659004